jgi:hypothetical protein
VQASCNVFAELDSCLEDPPTSPYTYQFNPFFLTRLPEATRHVPNRGPADYSFGRDPGGTILFTRQ